MITKLRFQIISLLVNLFVGAGAKRWLQLFNFTTQTNYLGRTFLIPLRNGQNLQLLKSPPNWVDSFYSRILPSLSGTFVDVGANLGQTLMLYLRNRGVGQRGYIGVDPIPECCSYVRLLAKKNKLDQSFVVCAALSANSGLAELRCVEIAGADSDMSTLESSLWDDHNYGERLVVAKVTGDSIVNLAAGGNVSFIKIDVEGFEHEVLSGFQETLQRYRPFVLCEVMFSNHSQMEAKNRRHKQIEFTNTLLESLNYTVYHARHAGGIVCIEKLPIKDWSKEDDNDYDFVFVPKERDFEFRALCGDLIQ